MHCKRTGVKKYAAKKRAIAVVSDFDCENASVGELDSNF